MRRKRRQKKRGKGEGKRGGKGMALVKVPFSILNGR
jgi:hypothetical protein